MKDKKIIIIGFVVLLIIFVGGVVFAMSQKPNDEAEQIQEEEVVEEETKAIKAEDIGLTLTPSGDKKVIVMKITKLDGISSIEYEANFDSAENQDGELVNVPRGVVSSPIEIKSGDEEIKREVLLGTCSKNVCRYYKVVSDITFVIRVNYSDGTIGSLEEKVTL